MQIKSINDITGTDDQTKNRMKDYLISKEAEVFIPQFDTQNFIGQNKVPFNQTAGFYNH